MLSCNFEINQDTFVHFIDMFKINYLLLVLILFVLWRTYKSLITTGIIKDLSDTKWNHKDFDWKQMYKNEELPPFYPNGWIPVLESRDVKRNQIKPVFAFGKDLVVFRGSSGVVHVSDAYCPHLGANIGVGGQVVGDSIRCPFHGWVFNSEGTCKSAPGVDSQNVPRAKLKIWNSHEVNGFIFVWHHSEGQTPNWTQEQIEDLDSLLYYRGRVIFTFNCHIQEIAENGADIMHFHELHTAAEFLGTVINRSRLYPIVNKILNYTWSAYWESSSPPKNHISKTFIKGEYKLFGYSFIKTSIDVQQIGPAYTKLNLTLNFLGETNCIILMAIIPIGPMKNKVICHFYTESNLKALILSKFIINGEAKMFERDIAIWNNKKYLAHPHFAKNEEPLVKYRRWFKQFYDN